MKKETNNSEYVKITKEDFDYLVKRSWFLNRLDEGGVDNWVGYEFSYDDLKEELKDSDMSAYELSNRNYYREINAIMEKPTEKQLNFIKVIEEEWKHNPFTGTSKKEATQYISQAIKEKERYDFEDEAMGYGLPNQ